MIMVIKFLDRTKRMPSNLVKKLADQASNEILLNNVNLEEELDSSSLEFIQNKVSTRAIKLFSLMNCHIGLISNECLDKVIKIITYVKPENICLSNNNLYLMGTRINLILNTLLHQEIQEVQLGVNDLGKTILNNPDLIINFLKNKTLRLLDLRGNYITDEMIKILAPHCRVEVLNLGTNDISSLSIPYFKENKFFLHIILFKTNIHSIKELEEVWERNKITKIRRYVNEVILITREFMQTNSFFNRLPLEILLRILYLLGLKSGSQSSRELCKQIMGDVLSGHPPQEVRSKYHNMRNPHVPLKLNSLLFLPRQIQTPSIQEAISLKNSI